jgi:hypothetical protein
MSMFVKLDDADPYDTFAVVMRRSRLSMERAYGAAFEAHARSVALLQDHRWKSFSVADPLGFPIFGVPAGYPRELPSRAELDAIWLDALAEDFQSDQQAAPVILTADDSLRRLGRGLFGKPADLEAGYGPTYGEGVPFTSLLQAATNALRHVSEWDATRKPPFPYQSLETFVPNSTEWQAIRSINVIQRAFGIGQHEPIRDVISMRTLVAVDGLPTAPAFERLEKALLETARAMARAKGKTPATKLENALNRQAKMLRATAGT